MRERPGDCSRVEVSWSRTHRSRSISMDRLRSHRHAHYSPPPTSCPLPAHGHRDTSRNLRTSPGSVGSNRYTTEAPRGTTGSTHSPTTSSGSHMPMTNCIGTGPGPVTASGHGIPHIAPRTARGRESIFTGLGIVTTANTRPRPHMPGPGATAVPSPASHYLAQPARGHHWDAQQDWEYAASGTDWHGSNPQAQAAAWEHTYSSGLRGQVSPMQDSSASISSAAEEPPQDWLPRNQSNGEPKWHPPPPALPHLPTLGPMGQNHLAPLPWGHSAGPARITPGHNHGAP